MASKERKMVLELESKCWNDRTKQKFFRNGNWLVEDLDFPKIKKHHLVKVFYLLVPRAGSTFTLNILKEKFRRKRFYRTNHGAMGYKMWGGKQRAGKKFPVSFAIIRNPYSLLYSHYTYREHGQVGLFDVVKKLSPNDCHWDISKCAFKEFVLKFCDLSYMPEYIPQFRRWMNSLHFCSSGKPGVRYLIRLEYLQEGLSNLMDNSDLSPPLDFKTKVKNFNITKYKSRSKFIHKTDCEDYRDWYDEEMIKVMESHFERELKVFNYSFDGPKDNFALLDAESVFYCSDEDLLIKPKLKQLK